MRNKRRCSVFCGCAIALSVMAAAGCYADIVHFKNGKTLEGTVSQQGETAIVVDVGYGQITFSANDIDRIEKKELPLGTTVEESAPASSPYSTELNSLISVIRMKRDLVSRYHRELKGIEKDVQQMERALSVAYAKYKDLSLQHGSTMHKKITTEKERQVVVKQTDALNSLLADIKSQELKIKDRERGILDAHVKQSDALRGLTEAVKTLSVRDHEIRQKDELYRTSEYAKHVQDVIDDFKMDWHSCRVPIEQRGNAAIAPVRLNNKVTVPMVVDTGASSVIISKNLAFQIGLKESDFIRPISSQIANGSMIEGFLVTLDFVQVGDMKIEDVKAVVINEKPLDNVEGLLGMTYLGNFIVGFDSRASELVLERFENA